MKNISSSPKIGVLVGICVCICFVVLNATVTLACECKAESPSRAIKRIRKTATVIFVGTIKEVRREVKDYHVGYWATFKVKQSWKSDQIDEVTVFTEGGCMAWFEAGRTYLVYASPDKANRLSTNVCMRTGLVKYATEDLRRLGKPQFSVDVEGAKTNPRAPQ